MVKIRPSHFCCGCLSLLVGIEFICLLHLLWCIASIAVTSSSEPLYIIGVKVDPGTQVFNAGWALLGIPFIIGAGVGMLYRIEQMLRLYFWYSLATFFLNLVWWMQLIFSGDLCKTIVGKEVQRMGNAFVCGFTDTFIFFWMLIAVLINLYCVYIIWSCAEEAGSSSYPELMKYSNALKSHLMPLPTGGIKEQKKVLKFEEKGNRPAPVYGSIPTPPPAPPVAMQPAPMRSVNYAMPMQSTSMPVGMPVQSMPPMSMSGPQMQQPVSGVPQSFFPAPLSRGGVSGGYDDEHEWQERARQWEERQGKGKGKGK